MLPSPVSVPLLSTPYTCTRKYVIMVKMIIILVTIIIITYVIVLRDYTGLYIFIC